ncbi:type II toxin-antitoxin system prevent-host-death family antitoxin [candidate division KSB1 bacterium]|nr:type II toxin-antitoxin system prevent-host-death family antitoxin [candidate division KSB1 bacterium]
MSRIQLDEDIRPLSEFRANVTSFIDKVRETRRPLVITQRGKSAAILLDVSEYEALLQKIELLSDIQLAEKQLEEGLGINHKDAKKKSMSRYTK